MRKIFTIVAMTILFAVSANAQKYINVGYGLGSDKVTFGSMEADVTSSNTLFAGVSYNFGITGGLSVEPGVNYVFNFSKNGDELSVKNQYHGIQIPVLFNYAFASVSDIAFKVFAGPTADFGLSDKSTTYVGDTKGITVNNYSEDSYSRLGISASFGLTAEWSDSFRFKLGYSLGINDLSKADNITYKQNLLTLSLGYIF